MSRLSKPFPVKGGRTFPRQGGLVPHAWKTKLWVVRQIVQRFLVTESKALARALVLYIQERGERLRVGQDMSLGRQCVEVHVAIFYPDCGREGVVTGTGTFKLCYVGRTGV